MSLPLALDYILDGPEPWFLDSLPVAVVVCAVLAVGTLAWHKLVDKRVGPLPRFFWLMLGMAVGLTGLLLFLGWLRD